MQTADSTPTTLDGQEATASTSTQLFTRKGIPITVVPGPSTASNTLYIRNLNERKSTADTKRKLQRLFELYGSILDIYCSKGIRKRGQAWVVFRRLSSASDAMRELQHCVLDGKTIVRCFSFLSALSTKLAAVMAQRQQLKLNGNIQLIQYARAKSDVIAKQDNDTYEEYRSQRQEGRAARDAAYELKKQSMPKHAPGTMSSANTSANGMAGFGGVSTTTASAPVIPDELLPPNVILFVQNLPPGTNEETLVGLCQQHTGFKEVRLVPGKAEIAFIEYESEAAAATARKMLHAAQIGEGDNRREIKVTYARK